MKERVSLSRWLERVGVRVGHDGFPLTSILPPVGGKEVFGVIFKLILQFETKRRAGVLGCRAGPGGTGALTGCSKGHFPQVAQKWPDARHPKF
jgi:hypothetical protein